jgi:hypothetical protein
MLARTGDARCALALGFERMAPGTLGAKSRFPDRPSPDDPASRSRRARIA